MTEAEWLGCTDPMPMLEFVSRTATGRKLRLFGVACSRHIWEKIDELGREAIEVAERYADGQAGSDALRAARLACRAAGDSASWYAAATLPLVAARNAALSAVAGPYYPEVERLAQAGLLRDIFGNPFRPPIFNPTWPTPGIVDLAQKMYEERDFSSMPILADALQEAGCDNADILDHCRGPEPHCRGCWLVDLLLHQEWTATDKSLS